MIASHILPWSKSNAHQKGDLCNGLLLSVTWDSLFDKGLITFDDEGKPILDKLDDDVIYRLRLNEETNFIMPNKLTNEINQSDFKQPNNYMNDKNFMASIFVLLIGVDG